MSAHAALQTVCRQERDEEVSRLKRKLAEKSQELERETKRRKEAEAALTSPRMDPDIYDDAVYRLWTTYSDLRRFLKDNPRHGNPQKPGHVSGTVKAPKRAQYCGGVMVTAPP